MELPTKLREWLEQLSLSIGSGDLVADISILLVTVVTLLVLFITFRILRGSGRSSKAPESDGFDRLGGIAGKLERLEMNTNAFRTEISRNYELLRSQVDALQSEVRQLRESGEFVRPKPSPEQKPSEAKGDGERASKPDEPPTSGRITAPNLSSGTVSMDPPRQTVADEAEEPSTRTSLIDGLQKTRRGLFSRIRDVFSSKPQLDEEMLEEIEALLVGGDLGVPLVSSLITELKDEVKGGGSLNEDALVALLKMKILKKLEENAPLDSSIYPARKDDGPLVVMMVGVNGVGKTTTTAKLAHQWKERGAKVMMVAADTFRAAAVGQLCEWGDRLDVPVVKGDDGAKPATVVFEAMKRAQEEEFDVVVIDTAGRLHNKANLMQELEGVRNVIQKHQPSAPHETILVLDGSTGQNGISQAREFHDAVNLTGLVVTKLDGTPKGGIIVAVKEELGIPIRYIGIGESTEDLKPFVPREFTEALLDSADQSGKPPVTSAHGEKRKRRRRDASGFAETA